MNKFNSAIYSTCSFTPWAEIALRLKNEYLIEPKHFIIWPENVTNEINTEITEMFPNCKFQTIYDAIKGIGFPIVKKRNVYDQELSIKISEFESLGIQMLDRFDPNQSKFSLKKRQWFFREILITWLDIIDEFNIDLVISPSIPHRGYDFALYIACKIKSVKFLTFDWIILSNKAIIKEDLFKPSNIKFEKSYNFVIDSLIKDRIQQARAISHFEGQSEWFKFYKKQNNIIFSIILKFKTYYINYLKYNFILANIKTIKFLFNSLIFLFKYNFSFNVQFTKMPQNSKYLGLQILLNKIIRKVKLQHLKYFYSKITTKNISDNFVLFPLHQQPEESTSPLGGIYVDQILVLKMLDMVLPKNFDIIVKEHSSQFLSIMENPESSRSKLYYNQIQNISTRIKFIDLYADTFSLIDKSKFVVTITGTVGWESVMRGKYSIVFGHPWYQLMPGVFKVASIADLNESVSFILNNNFNITDVDIFNYHYAIENSAIHGYICNPYRFFYKNISETESTNNIYNGIIKYLNL